MTYFQGAKLKVGDPELVLQDEAKNSDEFKKEGDQSQGTKAQGEMQVNIPGESAKKAGKRVDRTVG